MADEFRVQSFEVARIQFVEPPHFATTQIEHTARAIKLACDIDRLLFRECTLRVGKSSVDNRSRFDILDRLITKDAREATPRLFVFTG